ncbi:caspase family protein [Flavobacterium hercynium]|uniref:Peptidase C14 caspase domain-containing protein n=1 Tax=Flavobacterium hercynium TaxID=387094 RepID=A0A226HI04_9FLAO|nr:caspase family protein [Flavobacterium hercynium]OXA93795.1 hypothetical protein B0A66_05970 [Flavobacterium hercynium]SMP20362.1 Caspase domain-containing protein [Flavobacterium hercynium]
MDIKAIEFSQSSQIILFGIDKYQSKHLADLRSPTKDVASLLHVLTNPHAGSIPLENIKIIEQHQPKSLVIEKIQDKVNSARDGDSLLFYFAGHGIINNSKFYLCLGETAIDNLDKTALSSIELNDLFSNFGGRGLIFILDCCRSAGFAELAPSYFSNLKEKDFKILLSASRSEQNSWELENENGTLFTKHFVRVLAGEIVISRTSGLIYFSELFEYLSTQLEEDLRLNYPNAPKQEVVFTGVYKKDPLLFFHKDLSLKQMLLKTTRYSREYIIKIIKRATAIAAITIIFALGVTFSILDKSQFAVITESNVSVYKGIHHFALLGFPKHLYTLNVNANDLLPKSKLRNKLALAGTLGKQVFPMVIDECNDGKKVELYTALGEISKARSIALKAIYNKNPSQSRNKSNILNYFKYIQTPRDSIVLISLILNPSNSVLDKRAAIGCLTRISLKTASKYAFQWKVNLIEDFYSQREILNNIQSKDKKQVSQYLSKLLTGHFAANLVPLIFETAILYDVKLKDDDIITLLKNVQYNDGLALGYLMRKNNYATLQKQFENFIIQSQIKLKKGEDPNYDAINFILTALIAQDKPIGICDHLLNLSVQLHSNESMQLLLAQCPEVETELRQNPEYLAEKFQRDPFIILELARKKMVNYAFIENTFNLLPTPYHQEILINAMAYLKSREAIPLLLKHLPYSESDILPTLRVASIRTLREMNVKFGQFPVSIPLDWDDVTVEALRWKAITDRAGVNSTIISLMPQKDKSMLIANLISKVQPDQKLLQVAREGLSKSGDEKLNAEIILSMYGNKTELYALLNNKELEVRNNAMKYSGFNKNFKSVAISILMISDNFPNEQLSLLKKELEIQNEFYLMNKAIRATSIEKKWLRDIICEKYKEYVTDGTFYLMDKD